MTRRILLVEDTEDNREIVRDLMDSVGYELLEANDGAAGLAMATEHRPDLILMDLSLPGMDGWEATRVLKADERTKHIPVVALTGHALAGASEGARKAGCDSFVTTPCLPDDLVVEVRRMLDTVKKA